MAEGIIFPLVIDLLKKLGSAVVQEIGSIYAVREELEKLQRTFSAIEAVLLDAEQQKDHKHAVKDWLEKLTDAAYDVDDLLDCFSYESTRRKVITKGKKAKKVRIFFSKHNQIIFRRKMALKVKNLRERLDLIAADRTQFHFLETIHAPSPTKDREYTHSGVWEKDVIGRDEEKKKVVKRLLEINETQNVSVDAIVGVGGMGKTMLAQSVFNHKSVKDAFDLRLWACISETFDLRIIVEKIIQSATNESPSVHEMDPLQRKLRSQIDEKKYLLVMDDVWNEDGKRWDDLKSLLMGGAKGSKILITTRSKLVAKVCQATSPYNLDGLSESDSWVLFKQMAFEGWEEPKSPNIVEIGRKIVRACNGVPLVIRTIGRLLSFKTSEDEWLSFKNNDLPTITQQHKEIIQVLKISYNHLPSHLKPSFAYCSLFRKDHKFQKNELIKLWVAEGFVQSQCENKCLEEVGNEYFMELIWRSIFQDVERNEHGDVVGCKMHDLIHDLARLVSGTECFTPDSDIKNVNERTRRVSFDSGSNLSILSTSQLKPYKLRTFLSLWSKVSELDETGLEAYILSLKSLRVLDLQKLRTSKVHFSIGMLKHLRFLNLSGNKNIKSLPSSITELHNLQTLNLSYCSLEELPSDIGSLINLRHFDISGISLIKLLPDSVTKLKFLQTLEVNYCENLKELPKNIGNMVDLRFLHLQGNKLAVLPNSIAKLQKLQSLNLRGCRSLEELPSDVSNLVNLKHLDLFLCLKLRAMPLGLDNLTGLQTMNLYVVGASVSSEGSGLWQLNTLVNIRGRLRIEGLHHLRKDWSQANSVNLKDNHGVRDLTLEWREFGYNPDGVDPDFVVLEKLHPNKNVKTLSIVGYGGVGLSSWVSSLSNLMDISIVNCERLQYVPRLDRLPNLQKLKLSNINQIEYMDNNETVEEFDSSVFFPSLQSLDLRNMDKLKGWWKTKDPGQTPSFHCLSSLSIKFCPRLLSIPSPNSSLTTLTLSCSGTELFKGLIGSASPEDDSQQEALDGHADLHSEGVPKLATLPVCVQHLTALQSLYIIQCVSLLVLPDWIGRLTSLQKLVISYCPKLTSLPDGIRQLSSLWSLTIKLCHDLLVLPDWIGSLTSLQKLEIIGCSKLTSLPDGIRQLSSLWSLTIKYCGRLEERCAQQIGEDWSKIAHVKNVKIGE